MWCSPETDTLTSHRSISPRRSDLFWVHQLSNCSVIDFQVRNECVALGGRAPLTDIATTLNVDLEHVERAAHELVNDDAGFTISGGELFAE